MDSIKALIDGPPTVLGATAIKSDHDVLLGTIACPDDVGSFYFGAGTGRFGESYQTVSRRLVALNGSKVTHLGQAGHIRNY